MSPSQTAPPDVGVLQRENERLQRAVHELSMLNDLARAIGGSARGDEVMNTIINRSLKAVDAQQGTITLVTDKAANPTETLARAVTSSVTMGKFHLSDAIVGWMGVHRKPLVIDDVQTDGRFRGMGLDPGISNVLAVPLMVKSGLVGVLTVYNKHSGKGFDPDDQRLLSIIASQSAQVVENARLYEEEQALIRMKEQLRLAGEVQKHLLPVEQPSIDGYEILGTSVAAQEIGGDYFDFLPAGEGSWAISLGDVSGKGLPASLLMANVQAMVRMLVSMNCPVDETMERANELLCHCTPYEKFVTFFHSVLDPERHRLEFCNAGHNPPLLVGAGEPQRLRNKGVVLGIVEKFKYHGSAVDIAPGDVLVIFSDGVTEAVDIRDEEFGEERLLTIVSDSRNESAATIQERILDAVRKHAGSRAQNDDITLIVLKRVG